MCGIIAGVAAEKGEVITDETTEVRAKGLTERLTHRGPDDAGVHVSPGFWMGHTRLSIVDPAHGHQPLTDKEKTTFVVANGEIYNHVALKEELGITEDELVTKSDSEVIIHGYKKIGVDICGKLLGMFGFVLTTEDGEVLACRDKVGVKPLYMGKSKDGKEMLFASELKGIVDQCEPQDLLLVPAGHYWTRETGLVDYYQPEWDQDNFSAQFDANAEQGNKPRFATSDECKAALEEAVIARCMADVEVGLLLSGGLDSSIIGAIMIQPHVKKHLTATGKIKSFAVGQEGSPDILAARAVSKQLGTEHIEAIFTPEMAFEVLDKIVYHAETYEPELIRSCIPNYFLAKKTAEHVKVVLTGEGSDELWSGYLYYGDCDDAAQLQEENRRILKAVQFVNLQRSDRMSMAHSLEARVPFFDVNNISVAMRVDPAQKLIMKENSTEQPQHCEKYFLRKMYEDIVAPEVVWRTKAMQCEGVGMTWVATLQQYISEKLVSDEDFANAATRFPNNTPHSKEEYYYRSVFDNYFPDCDKFVHVWDNGCRAAGAPWKNEAYTRAGLIDTERLRKGHGLGDQITV
eukprot:TRINITY_DN7440_c0_g4_i1.p1 TRINITY_DN7440_c0_g4~~TRINITY_DN7440_c0_g4_i1.p1  ORF type:complete len:574 (+),score=176.55 TRINITY_DN7440_c0_g4_i1:38-1759(+)